MLNNLLDKYQIELDDIRQAESNAAHNFAMLKLSLEGQLAQLSKDLDKADVAEFTTLLYDGKADHAEAEKRFGSFGTEGQTFSLFQESSSAGLQKLTTGIDGNAACSPGFSSTCNANCPFAPEPPASCQPVVCLQWASKRDDQRQRLCGFEFSAVVGYLFKLGVMCVPRAETHEEKVLRLAPEFTGPQFGRTCSDQL